MLPNLIIRLFTQPYEHADENAKIYAARRLNYFAEVCAIPRKTNTIKAIKKLAEKLNKIRNRWIWWLQLKALHVKITCFAILCIMRAHGSWCSVFNLSSSLTLSESGNENAVMCEFSPPQKHRSPSVVVNQFRMILKLNRTCSQMCFHLFESFY